MVRAERKDSPGSWHHVVNRGLAKRTVFEDRTDYRRFLAWIARAGRRGLLEVHAYSLLPNHFHLLVRSPSGDMDRGMALVQKEHARAFNRRRRRDGPLFRGRFHSRLIESETYWWTVLRYIDFNPVKAGLVARPEDYIYGSAYHYARVGPRPRWLYRGSVERAMMGGGVGPYDPARAALMMSRAISGAEMEMVERRSATPHPEGDPLDPLLNGTPACSLEWQRERARLADGATAGVPVATAGTLLRLIREIETEQPTAVPSNPGSRISIWTVLTCGLLRTAGGLALGEIARHLGRSEAAVCRQVKMHQRRLLEDDAYAGVASAVLANAVRADWSMSRASGVL